jgi:hypothetical protein
MHGHGWGLRGLNVVERHSQTGDLTHLSKPAEFDTLQQVLSELSVPVFYVPGVHDVLEDDGKSYLARFRIHATRFTKRNAHAFAFGDLQRRADEESGRQNRAMHEIPHSPRHDPEFRSWLVWEHGDVLQEVSVGIAKEHGRGRHPGEDDGLLRWPTVEVERRNARGTQGARRLNHIREGCAKRGV